MLWWKTYRYYVIATALLVIALCLIPWQREKVQDPVFILQQQIDEQNQRIDSLINHGQQLQIGEKEIQIKWQTKNEKSIIYILTSADTMQPVIRSKQRARADSILARY